ncbi:MAG: helix-hairpin-helix domain-containing protein [Sphaerimonospora mesophila]
MNQQLQAKLKTLPSGAGVYFHKSAAGEIIYVGKAAVLKNRVRQYFQSKKDMDAKTLALVGEIADTEWIETESEIDALFLESEMVKRYMPRYNILLRDDKSQTFVRITMQDEIPFVSFTRQPLDDGADYYGPFYNGSSVKNALRLLRKVFPYYAKPVIPSKPGLEFQLGLSPGVEAGAITPTDYKKSLRQLISYIKGNRKAVQKDMEKDMKAAAEQLDFELAARLRNQLYHLAELQRQIVFSREEFLDISKDQALLGLTELLKIEKAPRRIEAYDVSHISGRDNVASMVVATNGLADKREYRKFKLRSPGNDDVAHMRETIERRLKHLNGWGRPDLIVLDGGVGQLGAVKDLLNEAKIPFIGRNKSGDHTRNAAVTLVIPRGDSYETKLLANNDHIAKLIARLDDEAHRFAVSYHQTIRSKGQTSNILEEIPGIGPVTRKKLIRKFGSVTGIKTADEAAIAELVGMDKAKLVKQAVYNS